MNKGIGILLILIGALAGYVIGGSSNSTDVEEVAHNHTSHELRNVEENIPQVDLEIFGDNNTGYDAKIGFTNYRLTPENANGEHVEGEGHAHIYVDGEKINRVYGEWYHLGKFDVGSHEVEVRLSSNDHKELAVDGEPISTNTIIVVREGDVAVEEDHMHAEGEDDDHMHEEE